MEREFRVERFSVKEEFAMKLRGVLIAALMLMPAAALAAPGIVTTSVNMRAGPGTGFPAVNRVPGGARVNIHGCIRGDAWCDVSWAANRGWVSSRYLEYLYRNHFVYLPDYVDVIDVPIVPFVLNSYWANYYAGRPWYHRRAYWNGYWRSHARFAMRRPAVRPGHFARMGTRTAVTAVRPRGMEGRMAHVNRMDRAARINGAGRTFVGRQPMVRTHQAAGFRAAPMARQAMRPTVSRPNMAHMNAGRVGRPPMNARAQMGGARPMGGMPHMGGARMGGGGGPRINAGAHIGGGGHPGGGGGRPHR
jgi:uncharacterized protein YraI